MYLQEQYNPDKRIASKEGSGKEGTTFTRKKEIKERTTEEET